MCWRWTSGTPLPDRIPRTRAADLAWLPDGTGFYYTRYPAPGEVPEGEEHYHRAVFFHRLGSDPAGDPLVFRPAEKEHWPGVGLIAGRPLAGHRRRPHLRPDRSLPAGPARQATPPVPVAEDLPATFDGEVVRGRLYLRTNLDAPTYRLYRGGSGAARAEGWREIVPPRADAVLDGFVHRRLGAGAELSRASLVAPPPGRSRGGRGSATWPCPRSAACSASRANGTGTSCSTASPPTPCRRACIGWTSRPAAARSGAGSTPTWIPSRYEVRQVGVSLEGRHRGDDVPRPPAGLARDGANRRLPHRIRRVQHQHDAGVLPLAAPLAGATAASSPFPTSGAAASTARRGTRAGCWDRSRTASTISSPRRSG